MGPPSRAPARVHTRPPSIFTGQRPAFKSSSPSSLVRGLSSLLSQPSQPRPSGPGPGTVRDWSARGEAPRQRSFGGRVPRRPCRRQQHRGHDPTPAATHPELTCCGRRRVSYLAACVVSPARYGRWRRWCPWASESAMPDGCGFKSRLRPGKPRSGAWIRFPAGASSCLLTRISPNRLTCEDGAIGSLKGCYSHLQRWGLNCEDGEGGKVGPGVRARAREASARGRGSRSVSSRQPRSS